MNRIIFALGLALVTTGEIAPAQATPWESSRTTIEDLDNVCWGDRLLENVKTEFQARPYSGTIRFERSKTGGCEPGDRFTGKFQGAGYYNTQCEADVTVEFVDQSMANITWTITNAKNQVACPVRHTFWETQVVRNDAESSLASPELRSF